MFPNLEDVLHDIFSQIPRAGRSASSSSSQAIHSYSSGAAGSISFSANSTDGRATAVVHLTDANGNGIAGVPVRGTVQLGGGGSARAVRFPNTDAGGRSRVSLETVRPGTLLWTVEVEFDGSTITASTSSTTP